MIDDATKTRIGYAALRSEITSWGLFACVVVIPFALAYCFLPLWAADLFAGLTTAGFFFGRGVVAAVRVRTLAVLVSAQSPVGKGDRV